MSSASKTIRRAFVLAVMAWSAASMPLRSKVPDCTRSGIGCASRKTIFLDRSSARFQPKLSAFAMSRFEASSKATKIPGSLHSCAPCTRNWSERMVLPEPGPPTSSVVRPRGRPPPVISSRPVIPVGALVVLRGTGSSEFMVCPWKAGWESRHATNGCLACEYALDAKAHPARGFAGLEMDAERPLGVRLCGRALGRGRRDCLRDDAVELADRRHQVRAGRHRGI